MTKQPDPSRSPLPRPGSVMPSSMTDSSSEPVVPKLKTVTPIIRRDGSKPPRVIETPREHLEPPKKRTNDRDSSEPTSPKENSDDPQTEGSVQPKKRWKPAPDPLGDFLKPTHVVDDELIQSSVTATSDLDSPTSFTIRERIERSRHPLSSFLVSLTVHVAIFLILALVAFTIRKPKPHISIVASIDSTPTQAKPAKIETVPIEIDIPNENESPIDLIHDETSRDSQIDAANVPVVAPNMVTSDADPTPAETITEPAEAGTLPTGGGLAGRTGDTRASLAGRMGGTRESELAVELGLKWIVSHQRKNGSWHFLHDDGKCNGDCGNEGQQEAVTGATGMALMALLGAGYTHKTGQYKTEVKKGLDYLVKVMKPNGSMTSGSSRMYAHAIATIALSEALSMTNDTGLTGPVDKARGYIELAQHKKGGWRYNAQQKGDLSVTGWQIMALKSCELSGFKSGEVTYSLAEDFVESMAAPSQGFGYLEPGELPTMTAVGVLSKMYLGAELDQGTQEQSTRFLADHGPSKTDMYFNFYATQVLHHRHDEAWPDWNKEQRDYLIQMQVDSSTDRAGSWYFHDHHGQVGGRLYTTAMAVMILEVYYRYLPLYDEEAVKQVAEKRMAVSKD